MWRSSLLVLLAVFVLQVGRSAEDPWPADKVMTVTQFAPIVESGKAPPIVMVGPRILFNGNHIRGAVYGGPAGTEQGRTLLLQQAGQFPKDKELVIYCGCCPMEKCPNIRPAYEALAHNGYKDVRVLVIPVNLHTDWTEKGYPVEKGDVPK